MYFTPGQTTAPNEKYPERDSNPSGNRYSNGAESENTPLSTPPIFEVTDPEEAELLALCRSLGPTGRNELLMVVARKGGCKASFSLVLPSISFCQATCLQQRHW